MVVNLKNAVVIEDELALLFVGGEEVYLRLPLLRRACPCAKCQGEPDAMGRVMRPLVEYGEQAFNLVKLEFVGGYALQLFWNDGHSSGLYSYEYLQKLDKLSPIVTDG